MKIALIAHDKKKQDMIDLCVKYRDVLDGHDLYATGTTGTMVMGETGLKIIRMKSGPLGGDQQIGSMVAEKNLDMIIFLRDPLTAQPHEPDVTALLRLSDVMNIPLATNVSSATIMLEDLKLRKQL
ncbi:MAG: methylglyoxal synthase [Erysipelotrichaceae bacterium]|nr:methylglyoxal synthase [Erysipelotrichaceae bacterium]